MKRAYDVYRGQLAAETMEADGTKTTKNIAKTAEQIFPVWAAQGPFESGQQSATAMRYAYMAVVGPEEAETSADAILEHAAAYDNDPNEWEKLRRDADPGSNPEFAELVTLAKGFAGMDSMNELLEEGGHKITVKREPHGSLDFAYKQI
jgi:hypothetical protein